MVAILAMALPMLLLPISAPHRMAVLLQPVVWGIAYGAMPVAMQVWLAKTAQDASEAGMVLFVTNFQLSIAMGACAGGLLVDGTGIAHTMLAACAPVLASSAILWRFARRV
ncbi:hypothetical protein UB46_34250 [Burkholderiaceae bacterium 16]|nr:hypothetical protein UB46_34250 [Burkholderiaceae bacterium 16]